MCFHLYVIFLPYSLSLKALTWKQADRCQQTKNCDRWIAAPKIICIILTGIHVHALTQIILLDTQFPFRNALTNLISVLG